MGGEGDGRTGEGAGRGEDEESGSSVGNVTKKNKTPGEGNVVGARSGAGYQTEDKRGGLSHEVIARKGCPAPNKIGGAGAAGSGFRGSVTASKFTGRGPKCPFAMITTTLSAPSV